MVLLALYIFTSEDKLFHYYFHFLNSSWFFFFFLLVIGFSETSGQVHNGIFMPSFKQANDDNIDGTVPQLDIANGEVGNDLDSKRR